jgi:LmbE family N-acetylglucosaminyl deacetylase
MRILAVGAHPDDIEFMCAGTLAKYKDKGHIIGIAIATNGEVGSSILSKEEIASIRKKEAELSASIIGAEFYWLGYPDEFLFNNEEVRLKFIDLVRSFKPDIIICPSPEHDYHPDHQLTGRIIWEIHVMVTVPNIKTDHPPCEKIPAIVYMDTVSGVNFLPDRYVDITEYIDIKKRMLECHKSQEDWIKYMYGVTPAEFMEIQARFRGFQCGARYAEGFEIPGLWPRSVNKDNLINF